MGKVNALWMDEHGESDVEVWDVTGDAVTEIKDTFYPVDVVVEAPVEAVPMVREMKVKKVDPPET